MFDPATGAVTGTIPLTNPTDMSMTPDGSKVYVLHGSGSASVTVIDVATMLATSTIAIGGGTPTGGLAVSPDGSMVFVNPDLFSNISVINTVTDGVMGSVSAGSLTDRVVFAVDGLSALLWGITTLNWIDLLGAPTGSLDLAYVILVLLMF
jgi:YVTN family beta-propeller protein